METDHPQTALPWRELAARAATLGERLRVEAPADAEADHAPADARLARWRTAAASGDTGRFALVLVAYYGLGNEDDARRRLVHHAPPRLPPGAPLPGWVRLARCLSRRSPVRHARAALRRRVGPEVYAHLSRRAHATLEAHLDTRLDEAAAGPRDVERRVRRALAGESHIPAGKIPLAELFPHYPGLARVVAGLAHDWVTAHAEFLRRLHRDRSRIAAMFFAGADPGPVTDLNPGAGDAHRGGRSVLLLRFAGRNGRSPRRLVYKPRDVNPERVWSDTVDHVNAAGFHPPLRAARALPRGRRGTGAYGWIEWVAPTPRRSRSERDVYGRRAGALTCLFHVLGGTDGHRENVVAAGAHPVLVDAETLAHPAPPAGPTRTPAIETFARSVLRTFLVPVPPAFLPVVADPPPATSPVELPPAGFERQPGDGAGRRLDVPRGPFLAGFRAMARFLVTPSGARLRAHARRALAGRTVRRVWLPTAFYDALRRRSCSAWCLRDGVDRGIELAWLCRPEGTPRTPADVDAETVALERLDIPYLSAPATFPGDAPWLTAEAAGLERHLRAQAALLRRVLRQLCAPAALQPPRRGDGTGRGHSRLGVNVTAPG